MNKCLNCNKDTSNAKFCSRSCAASKNNTLFPKKKTKKKCLDCGKIVESYRQFRCKEHLDLYKKNRADSFKFKTVEEYHELPSVKGKHPSWKNSHIRVLNRQWNNEMTKLPCKNCGYDKHVELCHRKEVSSFSPDTPIGVINDKKNVVQLCRNCHWEFDHGILKI